MTRVVTSQAAVDLIGQLQSNIDQANEALETMLRTGNQLASPQVWEGTAANRFRDDDWTRTRSWVTNSVQQLTDLQSSINSINQNILSAGGGLG